MSNAVYIIGQIEVKDYKTYFSQYALKLKEVLKKYQGEALAGVHSGYALKVVTSKKR